MWKRLDGKESSPPALSASQNESKDTTNAVKSEPEKPIIKQLDGKVPALDRRGPQTKSKPKPSGPYDSKSRWNPAHFKLFVGNLSPDVNELKLKEAFSAYDSLAKAEVVIDRRRSVSKGYGFVAFSDSKDYLSAFREMNGKFIGAKPVQLKRANRTT